MERFFNCSNHEYAVMLKHEGSATDKTDASYLSTKVNVKNLETKSGAIIADAPL